MGPAGSPRVQRPCPRLLGAGRPLPLPHPLPSPPGPRGSHQAGPRVPKGPVRRRSQRPGGQGGGRGGEGGGELLEHVGHRAGAAAQALLRPGCDGQSPSSPHWGRVPDARRPGPTRLPAWPREMLVPRCPATQQGTPPPSLFGDPGGCPRSGAHPGNQVPDEEQGPFTCECVPHTAAHTYVQSVPRSSGLRCNGASFPAARSPAPQLPSSALPSAPSAPSARRPLGAAPPSPSGPARAPSGLHVPGSPSLPAARPPAASPAASPRPPARLPAPRWSRRMLGWRWPNGGRGHWPWPGCGGLLVPKEISAWF